MSRLGKRPIKLPQGVEAAVDPSSRKVSFTGPKGKLEFNYPQELEVTLETSSSSEKFLKVGLKDADAQYNNSVRALWGLTRSRLASEALGVEAGFSKNLEIQGVGFRAQLANKTIVFSLGKSHPVSYAVPEGIQITIDPKQTLLSVTGIDKEKVGQVASQIRSFYQPEPYKGKGIRYSGERVRRKAGKTAVAGAGGAKK